MLLLAGFFFFLFSPRLSSRKSFITLSCFSRPTISSGTEEDNNALASASRVKSARKSDFRGLSSNNAVLTLICFLLGEAVFNWMDFKGEDAAVDNFFLMGDALTGELATPLKEFSVILTLVLAFLDFTSVAGATFSSSVMTFFLGVANEDDLSRLLGKAAAIVGAILYVFLKIPLNLFQGTGRFELGGDLNTTGQQSRCFAAS
jgi:hypothetical protein